MCKRPPIWTKATLRLCEWMAMESIEESRRRMPLEKNIFVPAHLKKKGRKNICPIYAFFSLRKSKKQIWDVSWFHFENKYNFHRNGTSSIFVGFCASSFFLALLDFSLKWLSFKRNLDRPLGKIISFSHFLISIVISWVF